MHEGHGSMMGGAAWARHDDGLEGHDGPGGGGMGMGRGREAEWPGSGPGMGPMSRNDGSVQVASSNGMDMMQMMMTR